jgi:hypothetical protein
MENAGILYGHLEYFTVIWNILWPFSNGVVIWYIFPRFGIIWQIWQPCTTQVVGKIQLKLLTLIGLSKKTPSNMELT